jgi:hypothetical protein
VLPRECAGARRSPQVYASAESPQGADFFCLFFKKSKSKPTYFWFVQNEARWGRRPLGPLQINTANVGADFTALLEYHASPHGLRLLAGGDTTSVGHHVFLSSEGAAWSESGLSNRVVRLGEREMKLMGYESLKHISSTMLRRIFVSFMS